jgi:PAS domain S-box-containing protein
MKGYAPEEIIGRHFSVLYTPEERESGKPRHVLHTASNEGKFIEEGWRVRKDGTRFWASVVLTSLKTKDGRLRGFLKITRDLTDRRKLELADHQKNEFLATLSHELRAATTHSPLPHRLDGETVLRNRKNQWKPARSAPAM